MKLNTGMIGPLLILASLGLGSPLAQAQGYILSIIEDKHEQPVWVEESVGSSLGERTLGLGDDVRLIPGRNYRFWFENDDGDHLEEDCPFLRVGFSAVEKSLDVIIPFNYIRPYDIPDALIGIVASPIAYSKWIEYLKLHKIGIYFRGAEVFQPLPEAPATGSAAMNEADDGPDLTPEAENKDVAPAPS